MFDASFCRIPPIWVLKGTSYRIPGEHASDDLADTCEDICYFLRISHLEPGSLI